MIQRDIEKELMSVMQEYPVVTIYGPRQAGKTTLARKCFPGYSYANLEDPDTRELAEEDYKAFFAKYPEPLIIDEIQRVPQLLSAIQVIVDEDRSKVGRFILTGSQQPRLVESVSQSLAGRTALLTLLPLSLSELSDVSQYSANDLIYRGFMPELSRSRIQPSRYYQNYFRTYVERDLRLLINVKNLKLFERFVVMLAGRIGQPINYESLSNEVGVDRKTLMGWVSILEASFIIYTLQPWYTNIAKRFTKSPKIYFIETGLAAYLLGIKTPEQLYRDPMRGHLFENMIVINELKREYNQGKDGRLYFHRTEKNFEIDLIVQEGRNLRPIEIKSAMTFNFDFAKNLNAFMKKVPEAHNPTIIYDGDALDLSSGIAVRNFRVDRIGPDKGDHWKVAES